MLHRAGDVDHEGQRGGLALAIRAPGSPGRRSAGCRCRPGGRARARRRRRWRRPRPSGWDSPVEVVDELFDAHGIRRRQVAVLDVAAGHGVGGGVHVQGEGGEVVLDGVSKGLTP